MTKEEFLNMVESIIQQLEKEKETISASLEFEKAVNNNAQTPRRTELERSLKLIQMKISAVSLITKLPARLAIEHASEIELKKYKEDKKEDTKKLLAEAEIDLKTMQSQMSELTEERANIEKEYVKTKYATLIEKGREINGQIENLNRSILETQDKILKAKQELERIDSIDLEEIRKELLAKTVTAQNSTLLQDPTLIEKIMNEIREDPEKKERLTQLLIEYNDIKYKKSDKVKVLNYGYFDYGYFDGCNFIRQGYDGINIIIQGIEDVVKDGMTFSELLEIATNRRKELEEGFKRDQDTIKVQKARFKKLKNQTTVDDSFLEEFDDCLSENCYIRSEYCSMNIYSPECHGKEEAIKALKEEKEILARKERHIFKSQKLKDEIEISKSKIEKIEKGILKVVKQEIYKKYYYPSSGNIGIYPDEYIFSNFEERQKQEEDTIKSKIENLGKTIDSISKYQTMQEEFKTRLQEIEKEILSLGGPKFADIDKPQIDIPDYISNREYRNYHQEFEPVFDDAFKKVYRQTISQQVDEEAQRQAKEREQEILTMMSEPPQEQMESQGVMKK